TDPWDIFNFQLLGEPLTESPLLLMGEILLTTYVPTGQLHQPRPFLIAVDRGAALLGGPLTGFEGNGFWAGADLNEPAYEPNFMTPESPRSLTLPPVDVTGQSNVQVT